MSTKVNVNLVERSYKIHIENGLVKKAGKSILSVCHPSKTLVLSTKPVFKLYGKTFCASLKSAGLEPRPYLIPDGESYKNEKILFAVLREMARLSFQRDSCLVALGGGVVGDLGGFAASIYMRGVHFVQCPTTFLAQVDAGIGGKTAIDFKGIKNLVGAFYQPKVVLADPTVLTTLSDRQFRTGLAEVIKYGIIQDPSLFQKIEKNLDLILDKKPAILEEMVRRSCVVKARIVSADEKESGQRAWLNYGHTLGHALESYFRYTTLTHGEAIAYGMWFAAVLSRKLGFCTEKDVRRQIVLLNGAGLFRKLPRFDARAVYAKMALDKKAKQGRIRFVLARRIGRVFVESNVPKSAVFSVLNELQERSITGCLLLEG